MGSEGFEGGYRPDERDGKENPELQIADKIIEDLKHSRCRYPDIRRQAKFYKPTLNLEQLGYVVQAAETKVVIEVAKGIKFPPYAQIPKTVYFEKQVENKKKEWELQVLEKQKEAEKREVNEQLKKEKQRIEQKLAEQAKETVQTKQERAEIAEVGPEQTKDRPDPETVYTESERTAFKDFFAGLVHIDTAGSRNDISFDDINIPSLIQIYGSKGAKKIEGGREVGYSWFNQDNGQQKNMSIFDSPEFKRKTTIENQEIRNQATNRHLRIYGIALAQYQMLKECGYTKDEIVFNPAEGVAYPKDFTALENYRARQVEKNKKIEQFNKENPQYEKSIKKVNVFLDNAEKIIANEPGYETQGGQEMFWNKHYPDFFRLQTDFDTINKTQGPQLELSWGQVSTDCGLGNMKLYDAIQIFGDISQKMERKEAISPAMAVQFLEIGACFDEEPFKSMFAQYRTEITTKINTYGPKLYPQMVSLVTKFYKNDALVPSSQDRNNVQNYTGACTDYLNKGGNAYYWNSFDSKSANYYNNPTLFSLQDHGMYIASDEGLKVYATEFHQLRATRNEPFSQRNADFEKYKTGGVMGRLAYGVNGVLTGVMNPLVGLAVAPINVYRQINLGYISNDSDRKQQMDAYMNGGFIKFIQAIRPPQCMESMTKQNGDFDWMNLPFKLSVQIMDSVMILTLGGLLTSPLKSGLMRIGMQEGGWLTYATNFFATMGATTAMHLQQHMETGLNGGLKDSDLILYGMFAVIVESGFESIGGLTPTSFAEMGRMLMRGSLRQTARSLGNSIGIENLEEIGTEHVMNITHQLINRFGTKNMPISGINEFKALILLTTLSVGAIQRTVQINQSLNFKAAFGTAEEQQAFANVLQILADHDIFKDLYVEVMVEQMKQELAQKGITKTEEELRLLATKNIAMLMELFGIQKSDETTEDRENSGGISRQEVYNNLMIIDDTVRCEKALAALQAKGLCTALNDAQKRELFLLIIHAHKNRNNRPTTNDDGTSITPLATVKDEKGKDVVLYPLDKKDVKAEYTYIKNGLLRLGIGSKDATAIAQLLMREGRCAEVRSLRDYQEEAVDAMIKLAEQWLKSATLNAAERNSLNLILKRQFLLEMATGSGKTFTAVSMINRLHKMREELIAHQPELGSKLPPLKVLVLSHQIAIADQHRQDFFVGKSVEDNPLLDEDIITSSHVRVFHSKADVNADTGEAIETGDDAKVQEDTGSGPNEFVFATHQTAAKGLDGFLPNIIIADEAHHTDDENSNYYLTLQRYATQKDQNGTLPLVINLTATPTDNLRTRVGENKFTYSLPEYLASEYSPDVVYRAVGFGEITQAWINAELTRISAMSRPNQKEQRKQALKELKERLEQMKKKFDDPTVMVDDLNERLEGDFSQTIIFAKSIAEADKIAEYINQEVGEGTAEAMHSKSPRATKDILADYRSQKTKTLVVVDQLNEAIDLPSTKNIVFARGTNSDTIFKQQLGRGLRGNGTITIRDYVGSMINLTKINDLNQGMRKSQKEREDAGKSRPKKTKQITIFEGDHAESTQTVFEQKATVIYTIQLLNDIIAAVEQGTPEKAMWGFRKKYGETPSAATMLSLMKMTPIQREQEIYIKIIVRSRPGWKNTHEQRFDLLIEIYPSQKSVINALRGQALKTLNEAPPPPPTTPPSAPPPPPAGGGSGETSTGGETTSPGAAETTTIPDPRRSIENSGYQYTQIDGEIILSDEMSDEMKELMRERERSTDQKEAETHYDKVGAVLKMCRAKNIGLKKEHITVGTVSPRGWRKTSYVAIYIEQYNKTIFLSNEHRNATFIVNDKMEAEDMTSVMKSDLRRLAGGQLVQRIIFTNAQKREKDVEKGLFEGPENGGSGTALTETTTEETGASEIVYPAEMMPLIEKMRRLQQLTVDLFKGNAAVRTKKLTDIITVEELNQLKAAAGIEGNWVDGMTGNIRPREWVKLIMYIYGKKAFMEFRNPRIARFKLLNESKSIKELLRLSPTIRFANFGTDKVLCMEILGISVSESSGSISVDRKVAMLYAFMPASDIRVYERGKDQKAKDQDNIETRRAREKEEFIERMRKRYTPYDLLEDTENIRWEADLSVSIRGHRYTHEFLTNTLGLTVTMVTPLPVRNRLLFNLVFDETAITQFIQELKKDLAEKFTPINFVEKTDVTIEDTMKKHETLLEGVDAFYFQGFSKNTRNKRYQKLCDYVFGVGEYQKALAEYARALSIEIKQYFEAADFVSNTYIVRGANDDFSYRINGETHTRNISVIEEATGLILMGLGAAKRNETLCNYVFGPDSYTQAQQEGRQGINQIVNTLKAYSARNFIKGDVIRRDGDAFSYHQGNRRYHVSVSKRHQFLGEDFSDQPLETKNRMLCNYLYGERSYEDASNKLHEEIKRLRARDFVSGEKVHREDNDSAFSYLQGGGFTRLPISVVERLLGITLGTMNRHQRNKSICDTALGQGMYEKALEEEKGILIRTLRKRTTPAELLQGTTIEYTTSLNIRGKNIGLIDDINNLLGIELSTDKPKEQNNRILCDAIFGQGAYDAAGER